MENNINYMQITYLSGLIKSKKVDYNELVMTALNKRGLLDRNKDG